MFTIYKGNVVKDVPIDYMHAVLEGVIETLSAIKASSQNFSAAPRARTMNMIK